jgi:hypothetical protein
VEISIGENLVPVTARGHCPPQADSTCQKMPDPFIEGQAFFGGPVARWMLIETVNFSRTTDKIK